VGAYARGPAFSRVHYQHAQNGGALGYALRRIFRYHRRSIPLLLGMQQQQTSYSADSHGQPRDRHDLPRAKVTVPSWKLGTKTAQRIVSRGKNVEMTVKGRPDICHNLSYVATVTVDRGCRMSISISVFYPV